MGCSCLFILVGCNDYMLSLGEIFCLIFALFFLQIQIKAAINSIDNKA